MRLCPLPLVRVTNVFHSYHSIRIDAVHYCGRDEELEVQRRRPSFAGRNGNTKDPPHERLQLLSRTVRNNPDKSNRVRFLKIPYMLREGSVSDLARIVSVLKDLRYVDLPDEVYSDNPAVCTLKQEVEQCADLRQMKYTGGAEGWFHKLAEWGQWRYLERLELLHLSVEPTTVLEVINSLASLRAIRLVDLYLLDDSFFVPKSAIGSFPRVSELTLQDIPNISATGLMTFLSIQEARNSLTTLNLTNTGVLVSELHRLLAEAPYLTRLRVSESVSRAPASKSIPLLVSRSLRLLYFDISNASSSPPGLETPADSYYIYLSSSIVSGSLPSLSILYALSPTLPTLLSTPPRSNVLGDSAHRTGLILARLPLNTPAPLKLFTKRIREMEWELTMVTPPNATDRRGSVVPVGPESLYTEGLKFPQYKKQGRESVMVGNGFGGFLAVPNSSEECRPGSPRWKTKQGLDSWMG